MNAIGSEGSRLSNSAVIMLSFFDARRNNFAKRRMKRAESSETSSRISSVGSVTNI